MREVRGFMRAHEREPGHVTQVERLALRLFDQLAPLHGLGDNERFMLRAAALLHDIGWEKAPTGRKHHKIAARMIREHAWKFIPRAWVNVIASVARYHRRSPPRDHHQEWSRLGAADRRRVALLAAILRVADGLDRTHLGRVRDARVTLEPGVIRIRVEATADPSAEIAAATKKADAARETYRCSVVVSGAHRAHATPMRRASGPGR